MEHLTQQEETAMRHLWNIGDGTVKEIQQQYGSEAPPYTTLASVVKNLERKKYVKARRVGNTYLYSPLVLQTEYKRQSLRRMVSDYFGGSYKDMVSFFVSDEKLSADELRDIMKLIDHSER